MGGVKTIYGSNIYSGIATLHYFISLETTTTQKS